MAHSRVQVVQWLFLVSIALFIGGIAFIIAAARTSRPPSATSPEVPATAPVATVKQIMNAIVLPNANVIYNAVGSIVDGTKVEEIAPKNDQEWTAVLHAALHRGRESGAGRRRSEETRWRARRRRRPQRNLRCMP